MVAEALSWIGRHSAIAVLHEGSLGVHAAAGRPALTGEHPPPPVLLDDEEAADVDDVDDVDEVDDVAEEEPVVEPLPPEPPAPELALALADGPVPVDVAAVAVDDAPPAALPAAEDDASALEDEAPPPPLEIDDEQAVSVRAGTARVTRRVKRDRLFIPGA